MDCHFGCATGIASGGMVTEMAKGKTVSEARKTRGALAPVTFQYMSCL